MKRARHQSGRPPGHHRRGGARPTRRRGPKAEPLRPSADPPDIRSFREWELGEETLEAIADMGIEVPTPIQRLTIQAVLDGRDVIAQAETGTGKTLAFGAPMIARIDAARSSVLALVLAPTRELAQQVAKVLERLGAARGITVALVVGGEPAYGQIDALKAGAQVVVGTPGRVLDLQGQGFLRFPWAEFAVLDEADEMLEIGFLDDVRKILSFLPDERQTMLFSATFPEDLLTLAREGTRDPVEIATARGVATVDNIAQSYLEVGEAERDRSLVRLIEQSGPKDVFLIFCDRRTEVDSLIRRLMRLPYPIKSLHGGYDQPSRFRVMSAFRTGEVKALVATDVASRGLDVVLVTHVVNYSVPNDVLAYTHRIGRTGRAGRQGHAITLVTPRLAWRWRQIVRDANWEIVERPAPERTPSSRGPRRGREEGRRGRATEEGPRPERSGRRRASTRERPSRERGARSEREAPEESRGPRPARSRSRRGPSTQEPPTREREGRGERKDSDEIRAPRPVEGRSRRGLSTRERLAAERARSEGKVAAEGPPKEPERARADRERRPRRGRKADGDGLRAEPEDPIPPPAGSFGAGL